MLAVFHFEATEWPVHPLQSNSLFNTTQLISTSSLMKTSNFFRELPWNIVLWALVDYISALICMQKCCRFDIIFITGCTGSCHFDHLRCGQWLKFHQYEGKCIIKKYNLLVGVQPRWQTCLLRLSPWKFHGVGWEDSSWWRLEKSAVCSNIKMPSYQYKESQIKIRWSHNRLIFIMGFLIPMKDSLDIEMGLMVLILRQSPDWSLLHVVHSRWV